MKSNERRNDPAWLEPAELARLGSLELRARGIVEGFLQGLQLSPFLGFSVEFSSCDTVSIGWKSPPIATLILWAMLGEANNIMSFIQAGFLLTIGAIASPVIVHLLNRWHVRRIELGTMRFLEEIVRESARRRTIRRWLLLFTRIILVTVLALLFARPFFLEGVRRDGERVRIILVDRSASMAMPGKRGRLIDDAIAVAKERADELGEEAIRVCAWFDRDVEVMPESTLNSPAPKIIVGDTNYTTTFTWVRNRVDAYPHSVIDVVMVTSVGTAEIYRIEVRPTIDVVKLETVVTPPAYTRLETREFADADITVLENSSVRVIVRTNHPIAHSELRLGKSLQKMATIKPEAGDDLSKWSFELPSTKSLHWEFTGTAADGTPMKPLSGRLRVRQDQPPKITWRDPADEIRVHSLAELPMRAQIRLYNKCSGSPPHRVQLRKLSIA